MVGVLYLTSTRNTSSWGNNSKTSRKSRIYQIHKYWSRNFTRFTTHVSKCVPSSASRRTQTTFVSNPTTSWGYSPKGDIHRSILSQNYAIDINQDNLASMHSKFEISNIETVNTTITGNTINVSTCINSTRNKDNAIIKCDPPCHINGGHNNSNHYSTRYYISLDVWPKEGGGE